MSPTSFLRRHHGLRRRHRVVSVLIVSVVVMSCATTTASAAPKEGSKRGQSTAAFAKRVDIGGGRSMYVECRGKGSPTVLLLSGSGTASDLWHAAEQKTPKVYPQIGKMTRTCTYDRPGVTHLDGELSRSDPVPQPTTPQNGVDDLDALLKAIDAKGPYVLVAHSFAGNIARVFAAEHPDQVKGIVFVDILTPELRAQMTPAEWDVWKFANARPADAIAEYPALERQDFDVTLDQTAAAAPLRPMPLVVLTASKKFAALVPKYIDEGVVPPSVPRDFGEVIDRTNSVAQNELAALVPGAVHITNTHAGHNIMIDNGPLTIRAIRRVVDAVRAGDTSLLGSLTSRPHRG